MGIRRRRVTLETHTVCGVASDQDCGGDMLQVLWWEGSSIMRSSGRCCGNNRPHHMYIASVEASGRPEHPP